MYKRIVSLLLGIVLAIACLPTFSFSEAEEETPSAPVEASDPLEAHPEEEPAEEELTETELNAKPPAEESPAEELPTEETEIDPVMSVRPAANVKVNNGDEFELVKSSLAEGDVILIVGSVNNNLSVMSVEAMSNGNGFVGTDLSLNSVNDRLYYDTGWNALTLSVHKVGDKVQFSTGDQILYFDGYSGAQLKLGNPTEFFHWTVSIVGNSIATLFAESTPDNDNIIQRGYIYCNNSRGYRFIIKDPNGFNATGTPLYLYRKTKTAAPATYTVTYDANDGQDGRTVTDMPESQTKTENEPLTLSVNVPIRDGYRFCGWATSSDGPAQYQSGEIYDENNPITLYAVWERITVTVEGCSLNLSGQIGINFYVKAESGVGYATLTKGTEIIEFVLSDTEPTYQKEKGLYRLTYPNIRSVEMDDRVTLRAYSNNRTPLGLLDSEEKSITGDAMAYCVSDWTRSMSGSEGASTQTLANALANYGAYAKLYFVEGATDEPCLATETQAVQPNSENDEELPDNHAALGYLGNTLLLEGDTTLRLYFDQPIYVQNAAENGYGMGQTADGKYYVQKTGIASSKLANKYVFLIGTEEGGEAFRFAVSALSYANGRIASSDAAESIRLLSKALYLYCDAAKAYFNR